MRWSVLYEQRTGRQAESECVLRVNFRESDVHKQRGCLTFCIEGMTGRSELRAKRMSVTRTWSCWSKERRVFLSTVWKSDICVK